MSLLDPVDFPPRGVKDLRNAIQKAAAKVAMPGWRNKANGPFWNDYDAVIAPEKTPRGNNYDVWVEGEIIATAHSLADAKSRVESIHGPQEWKTVSMTPYLDLEAPLGPTTEFTSPTRLYVVEFLA